MRQEGRKKDRDRQAETRKQRKGMGRSTGGAAPEQRKPTLQSRAGEFCQTPADKAKHRVAPLLGERKLTSAHPGEQDKSGRGCQEWWHGGSAATEDCTGLVVTETRREL
jgi:hypothetical protein